MAEYIERQKAIDLFYQVDQEYDGSDGTTVISNSAYYSSEDIESMLSDLPDEDVAPVQYGGWISVEDRLPEENEYVIIWDGKLQIAKIEKGISKKERELMKNGEINDPVEIGWNASGGYRRLRRSELYRACDEGWNNNAPYCWYVNGGMSKLFGQNVTHWMPLPQPPKEG